MFLMMIDYDGLVFTLLFCIFFVIAFLVLNASRLEECFKKGKLWQIRAAYIILSFVVAVIMAYGMKELVNSFIIK
jgi:uncharacterized membrane protein YwzB